MSVSASPAVVAGTALVMMLSPVAPVASSTSIVREWASTPSLRASDGGFRSASRGYIVVPTGYGFTSDGAVREPYTWQRLDRIMQRVDELSRLEPGWLGPGSLAPASDVLNWIRHHTDLLARAPHNASLIPMEDGSVAIRWEAENRDFTAELRPGLTLYTLVDDVITDELTEHEGPLTDDALAEFILESTA